MKQSISTYLRVLIITTLISILHAHEHHSHRHRHGQDAENEERQGQSGEGNENSVDTSGSSSVNNRLNFLEREVQWLCMEDEEDTERRIRNLGVKCVCPTTEAPVCGSDNVTYHNRCYLNCHSNHLKKTTYYRYRVTLKHYGACGHEMFISQSTLDELSNLINNH